MEANNERTIYTVGHSTHTMERFIGLLRRHGITAIADVRSSPHSRTPHFNKDVLASALKGAGIKYVFLGKELGARREEVACYVNGQVSYEKLAEQPLFKDGLHRIQNGMGKYPMALMCAEKEPLECHRTIFICRSLRNLGIPIKHILADGTAEDHGDTEARLVREMDVASNLFEQNISSAEAVGRAYDKKAKEIAHRVGDSSRGHEDATETRGTPQITIFTIGFAKKQAREFFAELQHAGVKRVMDIRLNNTSQLAGFTKKQDLAYFLEEIANVGYVHRPDLAPTKDILDDYKKKRIEWAEYERQFHQLMQARHIEGLFSRAEMDGVCLLCSEPSPEKCHRRLVAEYLRDECGNVEIRHL